MHAGQISPRFVLCSCLYLSEHMSGWKHEAGSVPISSSCLIGVKAAHVVSPGLSYFLSRRRSRQTSEDNRPTRSNRLKKNPGERRGNPFCCGPECDLMDTIHLQCSPPHALARDICNRCQGPINHPVSKRPCNAFYISTYVESKRVCHRCKPLSGRKKVFWKLFPA